MKKETILLNLDLAIEKQAKEIINGVIGKHINNAHEELRNKFDKLSDDLKLELSAAAKSELRRLLK